jgi:hypothetical protein
MRCAGLALILAASALASCDSSGTGEAFSLTVTVLDETGRPTSSGRRLALDYGSAIQAGPSATLGLGGGAELFPIRPTPWTTTALIRYSVPAETTVRIDLVGLDGTVVPVLPSQTVQAGIHFSGLTDYVGGPALRAGVYEVRLRAGADEQIQTTIRSDDTRRGRITRVLGTTGPEGMLTTLDRTTMPAFYGLEPISISDFEGTTSSTFTFSPSVRVMVINEFGDALGTANVTLRDGSNRVTVRLDRPN